MIIKNKITVGIVGGKGEMGIWFAKFFRRIGHKVIISDRDTALTTKDLVKKSDLVIFSLPINVTESIIKRFAKYAKEGSCLSDLTSIKEIPTRVMAEYSSKNVEVVGMHPVFGPTTRDFRDQVIVLTPERGKIWLNWLSLLYKKAGAKLVICSAKKHDLMMAIIQGIPHFVAISAGYALTESKVDIKESLAFSSPIYKLRLSMIGRILSQDSNLYADIEMMNPYVLAELKRYIKAVKKLESVMIKGNRKGFLKFFSKAGEFFGSLKDNCQKVSDEIIDYMVETKMDQRLKEKNN